MERLLVTQREELWEIPVHDAWFDPFGHSVVSTAAGLRHEAKSGGLSRCGEETANTSPWAQAESGELTPVAQ